MAFYSFLVTQLFHFKYIFNIFIGDYTYCIEISANCLITPACLCWVAIITPTDRPKSFRNRCVIEVFCGVFVLSRCSLNFSVGVGAFVIEQSQISSFFSFQIKDAISGCPRTEL